MNKTITYGLFAAALFAGNVLAAAITPTYDTFGPLTGATFGGSGIPNDPVAITSFGSGASLVTLGLAAHARYGVPPPVTNDGAGTFFAHAGVDTNPPSPADPYATWNFDFYIGGPGATSPNILYVFLYDFDPAPKTDEFDLGFLSFVGSQLPGSPTQNSWNLGMDFLAGLPSTLLGQALPIFPTFNPNSSGEYSFALLAIDATVNGNGAGAVGAANGNDVGRELGRSAILVSVPEPGTLILLGLGLVGLAAVRRKRLIA